MTDTQKTYEVQKTYEALKRIADNDPLTFREEWNNGLGYGALLSIWTFPYSSIQN